MQLQTDHEACFGTADFGKPPRACFAVPGAADVHFLNAR